MHDLYTQQLPGRSIAFCPHFCACLTACRQDLTEVSMISWFQPSRSVHNLTCASAGVTLSQIRCKLRHWRDHFITRNLFMHVPGWRLPGLDAGFSGTDDVLDEDDIAYVGAPLPSQMDVCYHVDS